MLYFSVPTCSMMACRSYRSGGHCAKDGMKIENQLKFTKSLHDPKWCKVRAQTDVYRLERMLED